MDRNREDKLIPIEGQPPDLADLDEGCAYRPRCPWAMADCALSAPPLVILADGQQAACFRAGNLSKAS